MIESYVYIGLKTGPRHGFYVKSGKSNNPQKRMIAYFTHCPGGLLSMYAAPCASPSVAFATETRLFAEIGAIDGAYHAGGEWFFVPGDVLHRVFDAFTEVVGTPERVSSPRESFRTTEFVDCELG